MADTLEWDRTESVIDLLVVDAHPAMRGALRAALELESGIRVASEVDDTAAALQVAASSRISLAIVDSRLAELQSPLALEALRALACRVPVVVTGMGDPALYAGLYVAAGASGYWAKDGELTALVDLLWEVVDRRIAA